MLITLYPSVKLTSPLSPLPHCISLKSPNFSSLLPPMITAVIKETGQGGGSTAVLQLITRCLEVTPVYTHTRSLTHTPYSFTLVSEKKHKKRIHSCGLIRSADSALSFVFQVKVERTLKGNKNAVLSIFHKPF